MDIYAKPGTKVVYADDKSGFDFDQEKARKYLVFGNVYTVKKTHVGDWYTNVYLEEVPDQYFNSVIFD